MTKPTTEPTETAAETVGNILTFKMCDCESPFPHGYFYLPNGSHSPTIDSLKKGRDLLNMAEDFIALSQEEKALHLDELATSGIPEEGPNDEQIEEYLRQKEAAGFSMNDDLKARMMSELGIPEELASQVKIIRV